jgi:putative cardiolipin synthase
VASLLERRLPIEWTDARLVSDDPAKTLDREGRRDVLLLTELFGGATRSTRSLDMISPYFVPGEKGTQMLEALARSGVRVRVLTNSLSATDVAVVHAGYAKRRCRLARAGVILFELKATVAPKTRTKDDDGPSGSSRASLHAKTYASDGARIFVGSFNFDPRSALLNTEMGLVIASPALASKLSSSFDEGFSGNAYEVRARADGECIEWIERTPAGEIRHATEPQTGWARRAWLGFLELLPIDWML